MKDRLSDSLQDMVREIVRDELKQQTVTITPPGITDDRQRDLESWTPDEDRELAKELREAVTEIAAKHERTPLAIFWRIKDKKIIFY